MDEEIWQFLKEKGVDIMRFADISALPHTQTMGYERAVVFCIALTRQFVLDMFGGGDDLTDDEDEFLAKERKADDIAEQLAEFIREKGYGAYAQSEKNDIESRRYDAATATSALPHKTVARLSGLGFIGKSDLLITAEYGSAFAMCAVLTDAPLKAENQAVKPKCGVCDLCVRACPAKAISGREWTESGGRESLVDVSKCYCNYRCMTACPWTLRYAKKKI